MIDMALEVVHPPKARPGDRIAVLSPSFAAAGAFPAVHEQAMRDSIPDLYLRGQGEYFDVLRVNIQATDVGEKKPKQALDEVASKWDSITRRMGKPSQVVQWRFLKSNYPEGIRDRLV